MGTALRRKKRRNFKVSRVMVSDLGAEGGDKNGQEVTKWFMYHV